MAAARLGAARGVAADDERLAALGKVAGVRIWLGDFPATGEADAVRMEQSAEATPIGAPAQIGVRVDRARDRRTEVVVAAERQQSAEHALQSDLVGWDAAIAVPGARIRIGEDGITHF